MGEAGWFFSVGWPDDGDEVEADVAVLEVVGFDKLAGEGGEFFLFVIVEVAFGWDVVRRSTFDFNDDDGVGGRMFGDDVDLAEAGAEIAGEDFVTLFTQITGGV